MLCNQIFSRINLFLPKNNAYILVSDVPFKIASLGMYTVNPAIVPEREAFCEVHYLKLGKCNL
jgi:hypothetical protein